MDIKFDARFHAFFLLTDLAEKLLPKGTQFTKEQADAIRLTAKLMAKDLLSGDYIYEEKK